MKKTLALSTQLALPTDAVTQKMAWLGAPGSGKTYAASKLAELFWEIQAQFVVLDPVGIWYGLRLAPDGKRPSDVRIPIFGGLHGDIPLEPTSGALMADLVVDQGLSVILDVSQFEYDTHKNRFGEAFADRLFYRKKAAPSAIHLFIEECQEFVAEDQQRGEEKMKHAFIRLQKIGRNFGIGTSLITQRPQDVAKKALNLAQTLFVFRTTGLNERKRIQEWIKDKTIEGQDVAHELPKLKTGSPHVWSPEWLEVSQVVPIAQKETFNASETPKVGKAAARRELAHIDLQAIQAKMSATIEKAKADDPAELRKQIATLRADLAKASKQSSQPPADWREQIKQAQTDAVERRDQAWLSKLRKTVESLAAVSERSMGANVDALIELTKDLQRSRREIEGKLESLLERTPAGVEALSMPTATPVPTRAQPASGPGARPAPTRAPSARPPQAESQIADGEDEPLGRAETEILKALYWLRGEAESPTKISFYSNYSATSSSFGNALSALRRRGLAEGKQITPAGEARIAEVAGEKPSGEQLRQWLRGRLTKAENALLDVLCEAHPERVDFESLGSRAGYSVTSSSFGNALSTLRSIEAAEGGKREGSVRANDVFFE